MKKNLNEYSVKKSPLSLLNEEYWYQYSENPTDRPDALESVRKNFTDEKDLRIFEDSLEEYQSALIALLVIEEFNELQKRDYEGGISSYDCNDSAFEKSHADQMITEAESYLKYQAVLSTYLIKRQKLKKALKNLPALHNLSKQN